MNEGKQAEEELAREYRFCDAEHAIRLKIASMDQPEELCEVVGEISE